MPKNQVLVLVANDKVGRSMAGPGIRYFELAKALSPYYKVELFVPDQCDLEKADFEVKIYNSRKSSKGIGAQLKPGSILISQSLRPPLIKKIKSLGIRYIADLYDPLIIETLEYTSSDSEGVQKRTFDFNYATLRLQLLTADHILCASERQKDLYFGFLSALKKINPKSYKENPDFSNIISLLPFGLEKEDPVPVKNPWEKFPGIKDSDKVILWGGGIWNWFDPLSVVKAVENISKQRGDVKLFFLGTKHPNPKIKEMEMAQLTLDYAKEHNMLDKSVFVNFGWLPYEERDKYMAASFAGISTHFNNLETRFSFRTRILGYLWAELPTICTKGDSFAELIEQKNLGLTVDYDSVRSIEAAIMELVQSDEKVRQIRKNIKEVKPDFYWENLLLPIREMIDNNKIENQSFSNYSFYLETLSFYLAGFKKKFFKK